MSKSLLLSSFTLLEGTSIFVDEKQTCEKGPEGSSSVGAEGMPFRGVDVLFDLICDDDLGRTEMQHL